MNEKVISKNSEYKKQSFIIPVFIGAAIGGVLGLAAYVKDWL